MKVLLMLYSCRPIQPSPRLDGQIDACLQTKIAAFIAEILAMHLFHSRQVGTSSHVDDLVANLSHYIRFAVAVPNLNSSLHTQLKRNFEARYPGCTPEDLKLSSLEDRYVGKEYFYDVPLAEKMLRFDQAWLGRRDDGLQFEFQTANVNLSLVDAQIVSPSAF
jgi:nuclear pore complex protein Nup188